jgi:hypothetical protein
MKHLQALIDDPPKEDSADLTDDEIGRAVVTSSKDELAQMLGQVIHTHMGSSFEGHELRRRGEHLYIRTRMRTDREPNMSLIFQVDWLGGPHG